MQIISVGRTESLYGIQSETADDDTPKGEEDWNT